MVASPVPVLVPVLACLKVSGGLFGNFCHALSSWVLLPVHIHVLEVVVSTVPVLVPVLVPSLATGMW